MVAAKSKSNEIQITRIYDAPVKTVWEAWTDPKQVAQWWGPRGFTITTHSKDLKVGGTWVYTMHGPDGQDYPNKTVYHEVIQYQRLVYDHGATEDRPPLFRVTVLFSDMKGKTKMDMTMALATPEAAAETRKFIKKANGNSTWDRLAEYLVKGLQDKEQVVINRSFNVPLKTMFEMWTNPKHLSQWLPPEGLTMKVLKGDIREGTGVFFSMTDGQDLTMFGRTNYLELRPHDRIVYTQEFCDKDGHTSRHPFAPIWSETMLTTVTLAEDNDGATRVTVATECHGAFTSEELKAFIAEKAGMTGGWSSSFDKLEEYMVKI